MKKRRFNRSKLSIVALSILTAISGCGLLTAGTAAWFRSMMQSDVSGINGSVLTKYFHCGTGDENDPFVITRPKHYENMIKLFYEMQGFSDSSFYFELGYDLAGDGVKQFYEYDDEGRLVGLDKYSNKLNCQGLGYLPPLGTPTKPFNTSIEGNGLTIQHLNIAADGHSDVGIFGYVLPEAVISNVYYESFTIDTTRSSTKVNDHIRPDKDDKPDMHDTTVDVVVGI